MTENAPSSNRKNHPPIDGAILHAHARSDGFGLVGHENAEVEGGGGGASNRTCPNGDCAQSNGGGERGERERGGSEEEEDEEDEEEVAVPSRASAQL